MFLVPDSPDHLTVQSRYDWRYRVESLAPETHERSIGYFQRYRILRFMIKCRDEDVSKSHPKLSDKDMRKARPKQRPVTWLINQLNERISVPHLEHSLNTRNIEEQLRTHAAWIIRYMKAMRGNIQNQLFNVPLRQWEELLERYPSTDTLTSATYTNTHSPEPEEDECLSLKPSTSYNRKLLTEKVEEEDLEMQMQMHEDEGEQIEIEVEEIEIEVEQIEIEDVQMSRPKRKRDLAEINFDDFSADDDAKPHPKRKREINFDALASDDHAKPPPKRPRRVACKAPRVIPPAPIEQVEREDSSDDEMLLPPPKRHRTIACKAPRFAAPPPIEPVAQGDSDDDDEIMEITKDDFEASLFTWT